MPKENEHEDKVTAYKFLFQGMHPRVRECDPRAYFRAKLTGLRQARESLLTDEEYAEERQEVLNTIVSPARYPPSMFAVLVVGILGGAAATAYGFATAKWGWVAGAPLAIYALWSLHGFRKHHAWLNAISRSQRVDIIIYLRDAELIDDNEASTLTARLDAELTSAT